MLLSGELDVLSVLVCMYQHSGSDAVRNRLSQNLFLTKAMSFLSLVRAPATYKVAAAAVRSSKSTKITFQIWLIEPL